jgi:hypothetical protein
VAILAALVVRVADAQVVYEFTNPGPATWYNDSNWVDSTNPGNHFVPSSDNGDTGEIGFGNSAFVDTNMADAVFEGLSANPSQVRVGTLASFGTVSLLEIRNGGTMHAQRFAQSIEAAQPPAQVRFAFRPAARAGRGNLFEDVIVSAAPMFKSFGGGWSYGRHCVERVLCHIQRRPSNTQTRLQFLGHAQL